MRDTGLILIGLIFILLFWHMKVKPIIWLIKELWRRWR